MAHHVYNTEGFILESTPSGEANRLYTIFTKDLGVIRATAQGVRLEKSKLRPALQDLAYSALSVVRGKDMWRITNAAIKTNFFHTYKDKKEIIYVIAQLNALLKRLMPGEQKDETLFIILTEAFEFLLNQNMNGEDLKAFERILVMRILRELGYMPEKEVLKPFFGEGWNMDMVKAMEEVKKIALQEINTAIRETQL